MVVSSPSPYSISAKKYQLPSVPDNIKIDVQKQSGKIRLESKFLPGVKRELNNSSVLDTTKAGSSEGPHLDTTASIKDTNYKPFLKANNENAIMKTESKQSAIGQLDDMIDDFQVDEK